MSAREIAIFQGKQIRRYWDDNKELWYFSIVDVVGVLSESSNPRTYWKVLKNRLKNDGSEVVTKCNQLKPQPQKFLKRGNLKSFPKIKRWLGREELLLETPGKKLNQKLEKK